MLVVFICLSYYSSGLPNYKMERVDSVNVASVDDLIELGETIHNDKLYLTSDISISDNEFKIGSDENPFSGVFDGRGRTVYLRYSDADENTSLFGGISSKAIIRNINFVYENDIDVQGETFGGIAKINDGTIENCSVSFGSLKLNQSGMFSPFVTINRGEISHILIKGAVVGAANDARTAQEEQAAKMEEEKTLFGYACVYNYGKVEGVIVYAEFSGFKSVAEENVLKGLNRNFGISGIRVGDVQQGTTAKCALIKNETTYTAGDSENIAVYQNDSEVTVHEYIFITLDFDNRNWRLVGNKLSLIIQGEKK
jgi:hypothetical protein